MLLYKHVIWSEIRIFSKLKNPPGETLLAAVARMAANH